MQGRPQARAEALADPLGPTTSEVFSSLHVWIVTIEEIADSIAERPERWGECYWCVPAGWDPQIATSLLRDERRFSRIEVPLSVGRCFALCAHESVRKLLDAW
jgi:hypothetical protein